MFIKPARTLATLGLFCSMAMNTAATVPPTPSSSNPTTTEQGVYSILNHEQLKEKKKNRFFINQDVAHTVDSDPIFPYHANPLYSFVGIEHFLTSAFSIGAVISYTYEKDTYTRNSPGVLRANTIENVTGFLPYINYLVNPTWLLTAQIGGYIEQDKDTQVNTDGTITRTNSQVFTPDAEAYVTWIGPDTKWTASVRTGVYYVNQRFRSIIDSTGAFFPTRHFESAAAAISARIKYYPDDTFWNAFLQLETDWRFFEGARPGVFHPDNARNTMQYIVGPGIHFKLNETWELRVMALHTIGFGYGKEERIGIRLRAAF